MSLIIRNIKIEDGGTYTIKAVNDLGEDSAEISLNVKCKSPICTKSCKYWLVRNFISILKLFFTSLAPPKITKPDEMFALASEAYNMSIEIKGNPEPTTKFYKNGKEIVENERIKFVTADSFYLIKFSKAELSDSGTYSVIATNEISQASEFWQFTVASPPTLLKTLVEELIVDEKEDIELSIKVNICESLYRQLSNTLLEWLTPTANNKMAQGRQTNQLGRYAC